MSGEKGTNLWRWLALCMLLIAFAAAIFWALQLPLGTATAPGLRGPDGLFAVVIFGLSLLAMWQARAHSDLLQAELDARRKEAIDKRHPPHRHDITGKLQKAPALFARDIAPLTFDVATHSDFAEVAEYRGLVHWHRDVIEKILSVFLVLLFSVFLGRACLYLIDFLRGDDTLALALRSDIQTASIFIGLALIVDGLILVAAMTDAPGIGRTLDSLIVILAGVIILFFDPGKLGSVSSNSWIPGVFLVLMVAMLFIVRWIIRHHTVTEWIGKGPRN